MMLFYAEPELDDGCALIPESVSVYDVTLVISIIERQRQQQQW